MGQGRRHYVLFSFGVDSVWSRRTTSHAVFDPEGVANKFCWNENTGEWAVSILESNLRVGILLSIRY